MQGIDAKAIATMERLSWVLHPSGIHLMVAHVHSICGVCGGTLVHTLLTFMGLFL